MNFVYYCVEDQLSRAVINRLIRDLIGDIHLVELQPNQGGFSSMKAKFGEYCKLAELHNVVILTDLDSADCAPNLRSDWMHEIGRTEPLPSKMHFRIAVREVEAWLIADRENICNYLGIPIGRLSTDTERHAPKEHLLDCVENYGNPAAKVELLPNGSARVGLGYNSYLVDFVRLHWDFRSAALQSQSLAKAINRLENAS